VSPPSKGISVKTHPVTKPGRYGTLYRYAIEYRSEDLGFGISVWHCWAYDYSHAIDQFYDDWNDGFTPVRWSRLVVAPAHRQTWHGC
jgi:hypothetical protein